MTYIMKLKEGKSLFVSPTSLFLCIYPDNSVKYLAPEEITPNMRVIFNREIARSDRKELIKKILREDHWDLMMTIQQWVTELQAHIDEKDRHTFYTYYSMGAGSDSVSISTFYNWWRGKTIFPNRKDQLGFMGVMLNNQIIVDIVNNPKYPLLKSKLLGEERVIINKLIQELVPKVKGITPQIKIDEDEKVPRQSATTRKGRKIYEWEISKKIPTHYIKQHYQVLTVKSIQKIEPKKRFIRKKNGLDDVSAIDIYDVNGKIYTHEIVDFKKRNIIDLSKLKKLTEESLLPVWNEESFHCISGRDLLAILANVFFEDLEPDIAKASACKALMEIMTSSLVQITETPDQATSMRIFYTLFKIMSLEQKFTGNSIHVLSPLVFSERAEYSESLVAPIKDLMEICFSPDLIIMKEILNDGLRNTIGLVNVAFDSHISREGSGPIPVFFKLMSPELAGRLFTKVLDSFHKVRSDKDIDEALKLFKSTDNVMTLYSNILGILIEAEDSGNTFIDSNVIKKVLKTFDKYQIKSMSFLKSDFGLRFLMRFLVLLKKEGYLPYGWKIKIKTIKTKRIKKKVAQLIRIRHDYIIKYDSHMHNLAVRYWSDCWFNAVPLFQAVQLIKDNNITQLKNRLTTINREVMEIIDIMNKDKCGYCVFDEKCLNKDPKVCHVFLSKRAFDLMKDSIPSTEVEPEVASFIFAFIKNNVNFRILEGIDMPLDKIILFEHILQETEVKIGNTDPNKLKKRF